MKPDNSFRQLTTDFLAMLPNHAAGIDATGGKTVVAHALEMIAISSVGIGSRSGKRTLGRSLATTRILAFIEARLGDPDLDPETIASAAGVSLRCAQMLMAARNTTIVAHIQGRRLDECRKALEDPTFAHRTVGEVALTWGFADHSHFSRVFKKRFGIPPREYRRLIQIGTNK